MFCRRPEPPSSPRGTLCRRQMAALKVPEEGLGAIVWWEGEEWLGSLLAFEGKFVHRWKMSLNVGVLTELGAADKQDWE